MRIYFKKTKPFRNFDYIRIGGHDVSATFTEFTPDELRSNIEVDGSDSDARIKLLEGLPITEAQLCDDNGEEFLVEGDEVFKYIDRNSIVFEGDGFLTEDNFVYLDGLKQKIGELVHDYRVAEFGVEYAADPETEGTHKESCIPLAFTTVDNDETGDTDIEVQVDFDLESCDLITYLGTERAVEVRREHYGSLENSIENFFKDFRFDALVSVSDEEWNRYHEACGPEFDDSPAWDNGSGVSCGDCPDEECTGHCMSCFYRPV